MAKLTGEGDKAMQRHDTASMHLLFIMFGALFKEMEPYTLNKRICRSVRAAVEGNKIQEAMTANGCMSVTNVDKFFVAASHALHESLYPPKAKPKPTTTPKPKCGNDSSQDESSDGDASD